MSTKIQPVFSPAICYKCSYMEKKPNGTFHCNKLKQEINERIRKAGGCLFRKEKQDGDQI